MLAGRLLWAFGALLGIAGLANPVFNGFVQRKLAPPEEIRTDKTLWRDGQEANVRVTLITADAARLACAHREVVDGAHCANGGDRLPWARTAEDPAEDNGENLIQPYRTSPDNELILLVGLWAQPEVAMRLHREPPMGVPPKRLNRFDVTCRVRFVGRFDSVDLRWDTGGQWTKERSTPVARAESCRVNAG